MSFFIGFEEKTRISLPAHSAVGRITLNHNSEMLQISFSLWSRGQYQEHWIQAVQRMIEGKEKSAMITNIGPLDSANFFTWWPMWNVNGLVHIQNQLLFLDQLAEPFDPARYYDFVGNRDTFSEDGDRISEWIVTMDDLADFVAATTNSSTL